MAKSVRPPTSRPSPDADCVKKMEEGLTGWKIEPLDFPTFRIGLLAKVMDRVTIRALSRQADFSYAQWRVLARLGMMEDGGTVRDIAELAWVDRAEVSRAVSTLEAHGLVTRRENESDRRAPIIDLTAEGRIVYRDILKKRSAFHEELLTDLSAKDRATLDGLLSRIGERLMRQFHDS